MKVKIFKYSIVLLLVISLVTFVAVQVFSHKTVYIPRPEYNKTGFIAKEDFSDDTITLQNTDYKFTLNTEDTNFELFDEDTNQTWYSTPKHETLLVPADARELFVLFYERKIEASRRVSVNDESIQYQNFEFRVTSDMVEVLYKVGGKHNLSMVDLPRQVSDEDFNTLIIEPLEEKVTEGLVEGRDLRFLKSQYNYVANDQKHYLRTLVSQDSIDIIYSLVFDHSLYTYEKYLEDSNRYGLPTALQLPYFEFAVQYKLTNLGLDIRLVNDSIVESEEFPIAYIDILPYFGAGNLGDEGYTVIPDGSGIFINHNNQKYSTVGYEKRVYGSDLSIGTAHQVKPASNERLSYPMYGYNKNSYSFIGIILEGDAMSTLRAGYLTESSGGAITQKIPYAHYRYFLRERDAFIFQNLNNQHRVTTWTVPYNTEDFVLSYQFIEKENSTYFDMAKLYQTHLVETYLLEKIESQEKLHITMLGGYLDKKYFLGFPYQSVESLTNVNGVKNIKSEIQNLGINDFSMTYQGFSNQGVKPTTYLKTDYNKNIATRKQLSNLISELKNEDIDLFLEFTTLYAYTKNNLNLDKDVTESIFHNPIYRYPYSPATSLADKTKTISYIQNTSATDRVISNILKTTNSLGTSNIALTDFGSQLASNLNKKNTMFRYDVISNQQATIQRLAEHNIQLRNPNLYALIYSDQILDLNMKGTMHAIVDYDIPFVPLILNGYFNYAGESVNIDDSKNVKWHMLKAIETGANIQFTFTNDETTKLIKTEYNYLISTYYNYWLNDVKNIYDTLEGLNIFNKEIINHRVLNPQGSLVEVTYEGNLKIQINYETESYMVIS
ncbi:DUF5696 domain-containing protein [Acholeplasma granularum]|uniref:DUF5696 domain-containing protein n=1 Tax=Acholeplasma granularum TaxID=264635 RepID=UPI0004B19E87|nr:DUF5696 domain-containing protein [Acholeplasma granularum]